MLFRSVYGKIVPHAQVRSEVGRLLAMTGWELATDLPIQDARVNPDYPKTTGTMFTLQKAPQLQKGVPALRPYLKAWQALSTLEVMFALPEAQASPNVERYENKAFVAELHKSLGVYRYEVTLKDHQGELPELGTSVSLPPTSTNQESSPSETKPNIKQEPSRSTSNLPVLLIVMGGILCIGAATYMSLSRRSPRNSPPPTIRR